jgi:hypothetical protein
LSHHQMQGSITVVIATLNVNVTLQESQEGSLRVSASGYA